MTHEMISMLQHVAVQSYNHLSCAHLNQVKQPDGGSGSMYCKKVTGGHRAVHQCTPAVLQDGFRKINSDLLLSHHCNLHIALGLQ